MQIGILALVGILTAIEGLQKKINSDLAGFGANSFVIQNISRRSQSEGRDQKSFPSVKYKELKRFKNYYRYPATINISAVLTGNAELKRLSEKTNPDSWVYGSDENYIRCQRCYKRL